MIPRAIHRYGLAEAICISPAHHPLIYGGSQPTCIVDNMTWPRKIEVEVILLQHRNPTRWRHHQCAQDAVASLSFPLFPNNAAQYRSHQVCTTVPRLYQQDFLKDTSPRIPSVSTHFYLYTISPTESTLPLPLAEAR